MSKQIVFFSTPAYGHLISVYPVIKKLIILGYKVDWYCTKKYENLILSSGANFIDYEGDFDQIYNLADITSNFYNLLDSLLKLNNQYYIKCSKILKLKNTDLILYDSMCSFAKNIAKKHNIKSICLCTTMAYNKWTFIFSNMFISSIPLGLKYGLDIIKKLKEENKFRRQNGIQKVNILDLFVNSGDKTIIFTPPELQPFVKTFPKTFEFVGTTIKDRMNMDNSKYKHYDIYISLGSIFTENKELLTNIINSKFLENKKVIINIGNLDIKSPTEAIDLVNHTNQLELLKTCELFINHGGLNSVYESISNSVLQVCIPQQQEQKMTAKIIARKKLGICIADFNIKKIKKLYSNKEKYTKHIKKYSEIINKYDGTKNAVSIIEKLLDGEV